MPPVTPDPKTLIRDKALELGFDVVGFASAAAPWPEGARLAAYVEAGRHGEMAWMAETLERRSHPTAMWDGAVSAIMLGLNYGPTLDPLARLKDPGLANISVYAQGEDYHEVIKPRLKALGRWMVERFGGELKVFVDTAPLMEKPLAARAGLGWAGKHTNLVSRQYGSWLFLGAILTSLDLPPDPPEADHCGSCRACQDICPTGAFPAPYQLDARACISYLTIEHAGPILRPYREKLGNRVYGCDDCLAVCPWNKFAAEAREARIKAAEHRVSPRLADLLTLEDASFRAVFAKSPVKRIGVARFLRNLLYAAGASGDDGLIPQIEARLAHPDPVVRGAAVWALSRLLSAEAFAALAEQQAPAEVDPEVQSEWSGGGPSTYC